MTQTKQWAAEQEFFDAQALAAADFNLPQVARRYEGAMGRARYPLEVAYEILGDMRGKQHPLVRAESHPQPRSRMTGFPVQLTRRERNSSASRATFRSR
jgi:hypothetical protein